MTRFCNIFEFESTWWRFFQKRVVCTKFNIYVFITSPDTLIIDTLESQIILKVFRSKKSEGAKQDSHNRWHTVYLIYWLYYNYASWKIGVVVCSCYRVYQLLTTGRWFSPGTPVLSTSVAGRYDIIEILLNVALNTITLTACLPLPLSLNGTLVPTFNHS